jgi:hypothetical protein
MLADAAGRVDPPVLQSNLHEVQSAILLPSLAVGPLISFLTI